MTANGGRYFGAGPAWRRQSLLKRLTRSLVATVTISTLLVSALSQSRFSAPVQLADAPAQAYSPAELWGGGSPVENCSVCDPSGLIANSGSQSTRSSTPVDPMTGDYSTTLSLFSIPTVDSAFDVSLTYDALRAANVAQAGWFGYGWQGQLSSAVSVSSGSVTVNEENGAQIVFSPPASTSDGCPAGDYLDTQKYTVTGSANNYCAPARVDGQVGYFPSYGTYQFDKSGGRQTYIYSAAYGVLLGTGNLYSTSAVGYNYSGQGCSYGAYSCVVQSDAAGRRVVLDNDSSGQMTEIVDPYGLEYQLSYDGSGDLTTVMGQFGQYVNEKWVYGYGSPGYAHALTTVEDPNGNTSQIHYYSYGMVSSTVDAALNSPTSYTYAATTCVTSTSCVDGTQQTTVSYPDHEQDQNIYVDGLLNGTQFGTGGYGTSWGYNWTFPGGPDADTTETVSPPTGPSASIVYDAQGNPVQFTDFNQNTTVSMYNDTGGNNLDDLCWVAQPGVAVSAGNSCTHPPSGATTYTYDAYGDRLTATDPLGETTRYGYYNNGLECWSAPATVTGSGSACANSGSSPTGAPPGATVYQYDSQGDRTLTTVAYGTSNAQTTTSLFDVDGELLYTIPPNGQGNGGFGSNSYETAYTYTTYQKPYQVVAPLGRTITYTYDNYGNVISEQDPAGVTTTAYDVDERVCWTHRASAGISSSCPVVNSNPDPTGPSGSTSYQYLADTAAETLVTDPNGQATSYQHDNTAYPLLPTVTTDQMGISTSFNVYDAMGHTCLSGPGNPYPGGTPGCTWASGDTATTYTPEGQLTQYQDGEGNKTNYSYNDGAFPMLQTAMSTPKSETTTYYYNANGDLINRLDPAGTTVSEGYDSDRRVCWYGVGSNSPTGTGQCSSPPSGTTQLSYNAAGALSSRTDAVGGSTPVANYNYDADGNLTSLSDDNGNTVSYTYDLADEATCIAYPVQPGATCNNAPSSTNTVVDRGYNSAGQLASTTDWLANTTTYTSYNPLGEVGTITYPATVGESIGYSYDAVGNVKTATYSGPVLNGGSDSWSYNPDEQTQSSNLLGTASAANNQYNQYRQVTTATNPTTAPQGPDIYSYQPNGPLLTDTPPVGTPTTYAYNADSQPCWSVQAQSSNGCTSPPGGATTYNYSPDGQRTASAGPSGSTTTAWNALGQLCWSSYGTTTGGCGSAPAGATSYSYDGTGLRSSATTPAGTQDFTFDTVGGGGTPLDIEDGTNAYIYGPLLFGGTAPVEQIPLSGGNAKFLTSTPSGVQAVFGDTQTATSAANPPDRYTFAPVQAVGGVVSTTAKGNSSLAVAPAAAGDALVLAVKIDGSSLSVSSVTGGGATWTKIASVADTTQAKDVELWLGTVTTAGPSSISLTYSATVTNSAIELSSQEFTDGTGPSTTWSVDSTGNVQTDSQSNTITYPSLSSSSAGELYVGYARSGFPPSSGSTPGFVYQATAVPNQYIYDTNVTGAAAPTAPVSPAALSLTLGALLQAHGPAPTIYPVGSLASAYASGQSTLAVTPGTAGDAMVLSVRIASASDTVSAVTGGGATWTKITSVTDTTQNVDLEQWLGTVTTPVPSTINVTYTNPIGTTDADLAAQEFTHNTGPSTTWSVDTTGNVKTDTNSTTITFPSLTPTATNELYVGASRSYNIPTGGSTPGFIYQAEASPHDLYIYNDSVSSAVSPTASVSTGRSMSVGGLLEAHTGPVAPISAVGSLTTSAGTGTSALAVSPQAAGDALVLSVTVADATNQVTAVTGGGSTWTRISPALDATQNADTELWLGTITTPGASTVNLDYAEPVTSTSVDLAAQEFTNQTGATTAWTVDQSGANRTDTATTNVTYPPLTPTGTNELYVGYARTDNTPTAGTTPGFTYTPTAGGGQYSLDPDVTAAVAPTASQNPAGDSLTVGVLLEATGTAPAVTNVVADQGPTSGANTVTITGRNFNNVTAVQFGASNATNYTVNSPTTITATSPNQSSGTTDLTVTTAATPVLYEQAAYSTYGTRTIQQGSDVSPFGFQGGYTDPTGLIYLINRYYDPTTTQFLSIDPLVDLTHQPYVYTGDDPLDHTDPTGLHFTGCGPDGTSDCSCVDLGTCHTPPPLPSPPTLPPASTTSTGTTTTTTTTITTTTTTSTTTVTRNTGGSSKGSPCGSRPADVPSDWQCTSTPPGFLTAFNLIQYTWGPPPKRADVNWVVDCAIGAWNSAHDDVTVVGIWGGVWGAIQFVPGVNVGVDTVTGIAVGGSAAYGCFNGINGGS